MACLLASLPLGFAPAVLILAVVMASDAWVYFDAKTQQDLGDPVILAIGNIRIETPEGWLVACLLLWVIALPLYLTQRRR